MKLNFRPKTGPNGSNSNSPDDSQAIYTKVSHYRPNKRDITMSSPISEDFRNGYIYGTVGENVYNYPPPPLPYRPANWNSGPNSLQVSEPKALRSTLQNCVLSRHTFGCPFLYELPQAEVEPKVLGLNSGV